MNIRKLKREEIDIAKWDLTIKEAYNTIPYGYSWYLDSVSENWDALVIGDYEVILPLPFIKKFGIKLYTQPILSQQLGPFSRKKLSKEIILFLFQNLPLSALRFNINLSTGTELPQGFVPLKPVERINQIIKLDQSIEEIEAKFSRSVMRNIKAGNSNLGQLEEISDPSQVIEFYKSILKDKVNLNPLAYRRTLALFKAAKSNNKAKFYQIKHRETGKPVCKGAIILDDNRVINLFSTSIKGKEAKGAATLYIYLLIKEFQDSKNIFDFEGSHIPSINKFFSSFGAETTHYYSIDKMHPLLELVYKAKVYLRTRKIKR
jgi:hypothetical protein